MRHPALTPCCKQRIRWDGDMWYCGTCSTRFMPERPNFEKPFPKKIQVAERDTQTGAWRSRAIFYAHYLAQAVYIF